MDLYGRGSVILVSDQLTKVEWFLSDLIEGTIKLPVRLIERRQVISNLESTLQSALSWSAFIINLSSGMISPSGSSSSHIDITLRSIADLMQTKIGPDDFKSFECFIRALLSPKADPLSRYLRDSLPADALHQIEQWSSFSEDEQQTAKDFLILKLKDIIDHYPVPNTSSPVGTARSTSRRSLSGEALRRENVRIIRAHYKCCFKERQKLPSKPVYILLNAQQAQDKINLTQLGIAEEHFFNIESDDDILDLAYNLWKTFKFNPSAIRNKLIKPDVSEAVGRQLVSSIKETSEQEFEATRKVAEALVSNRRRYSGSTKNARPIRELSPFKCGHNVAILSSEDIPPALLENGTIVDLSEALYEYGRVPLWLEPNRIIEATWLLKEHEIAIFLEAADGRPFNIPPPNRSFSTRRYLIRVSGDSPGATKRHSAVDSIYPVLQWGDGPYSQKNFSGDNSGRSADVLSIEDNTSEQWISYPVLQMLLRDLDTSHKNYPLWRRVGKWADTIPSNLDEAQYLIIAPLDKEVREVLNHPKVVYWERVESSSGDEGKIYVAYVTDSSNRLHPCLVGCIGAAGRLPATLFTYKNATRWKPKYVIAYGIAGALKEPPPPFKGDLILAETIIDYEYGKVTNGEFNSRARPYNCTLYHEMQNFSDGFSVLDADGPVAVEEELKKWIKDVTSDAEKYFSNEIETDFRSGTDDSWNSSGYRQRLRKTIKNELERRGQFGSVHKGMIATGDKVVADKEYKDDLMNKWLISYKHELMAVEMEGGGIRAALESLPSGDPPKFAMVRGICDDATHTKNDLWQPIAAKLSAAFALEFFLWHKVMHSH